MAKRLRRRLAALGLSNFDAYRQYLEANPEEWNVFDAMCRITISRFYRDRGVFDFIRTDVLPALARRAQREQRRELWAWSAGCASGEEPYTLMLCWIFDVSRRFPDLDLRVVATDAAPHMLERARRGCYPRQALRGLPEPWREEAFTVDEHHEYCLGASYRHGIDFRQGDLRRELPTECFDLILCRNVAFMYFDEQARRHTLQDIAERTRPRGALVIGNHDVLPEEQALFKEWKSGHGIFQRGY